jgi:hypothetical protein
MKAAQGTRCKECEKMRDRCQRGARKLVENGSNEREVQRFLMHITVSARRAGHAAGASNTRVLFSQSDGHDTSNKPWEARFAEWQEAEASSSMDSAT